MVYQKKMLHDYFKCTKPYKIRLLNFVGNKTIAHDKEVNTVEYAMAFLYCDWLSFLWHSISV